MYVLLIVKQRDDTVIPELENPVVPQHILSEIHNWREHGATMQDVERLRPRTVPPGYVFHTWKAGKHYVYNVHSSDHFYLVA